MAACAAPPEGWHRVTTLGDFMWLVPPLVVLFVGLYFALAPRRFRVRVLRSAVSSSGPWSWRSLLSRPRLRAGGTLPEIRRTALRSRDTASGPGRAPDRDVKI